MMDYLPWTISAISISTIWIMGNKNKWGPVLGFFSQGLWYWYLIETKQWGLIPCTMGFGFVHLRNWIKWWNDGKDLD